MASTRTTAGTAGLSWQKVDLHVHTPASADFDDHELAPATFVAEAIMSGMNAIAITDHNTGAWIDQVKSAATGTSLAIIPGVEISAMGGKEGSTHVIALFDSQATTKTIENLLGSLGIKDTDYGVPGAHTTQSPHEVINAIAEAGALPVLAHADSAKGVLRDMAGQPRASVMNHDRLAAVEVHDFPRYFKMLDGTDRDYRRVLAVYRASDNRSNVRSECHGTSGIGSRYSYFKMDGISLESLRQCFCDREVRIRPDTDAAPASTYPRIVSVELTAGFLKGRVIAFHEGLNCIIGGKGVGKSLLIEFMRFALNQESPIDDVRQDAAGKLADRLGIGGVVRLVAVLGTGQTVRLERVYDGADNPTEVTDNVTGEALEIAPTQLFPVLAYSQTEAVAIARSGSAQLALLDTLVERSDLDHERQTIVTQLALSDKQFATALDAHAGLAQQRKDLDSVEAQIKLVSEALASPRFNEIQQLESKTACVGELTGLSQQIGDACTDFVAALEICGAPEVPVGYAGDVDLKGAIGAAKKIAKDLKASAGALEAKAHTFGAAMVALEATWTKHVKDQMKAFHKWTQEVGGDRPELVARHGQLSKQRTSLGAAVHGAEAKASKVASLRAQRNWHLDALAAVDDKIAQRRESEYRLLTEASADRLEITLERGSNRTEYRKTALEFKRGSRLREADVELLVTRVPPRRLVDLALANDAKELARESGLGPDAASRLLSALTNADGLADLLALQHRVVPEDRALIRYRKEDGNLYPLGGVSIGQKCTALMTIALARGSMPIIVDQPEDALDIPSIYQDVTQQLRGRKGSRQFILTTHNATIAVAADADTFHVLSGDADSGAVVARGAIDRSDIRSHVIQHLEGGTESLHLKERKYGALGGHSVPS